MFPGAIPGPYGRTIPGTHASSGAAAPVSFGTAIRRGLTVWTLRGRISRSEYWWFWFFTFLVSIAFGVFDEIGAAAGIGGAVSTATSVASVTLSVVVLKNAVRRYHDTGRSGGALVGHIAAITAGSLVAIGLLAFGIFGSVFDELDAGMSLEEAADSGAIEVSWPLTGAGIAVGLGVLAVMVYVFVNLVRPGTPGPNGFDTPDQP